MSKKNLVPYSSFNYCKERTYMGKEKSQKQVKEEFDSGMKEMNKLQIIIKNSNRKKK